MTKNQDWYNDSQSFEGQNKTNEEEKQHTQIFESSLNLQYAEKNIIFLGKWGVINEYKIEKIFLLNGGLFYMRCKNLKNQKDWFELFNYSRDRFKLSHKNLYFKQGETWYNNPNAAIEKDSAQLIFEIALKVNPNFEPNMLCFYPVMIK